MTSILIYIAGRGSFCIESVFKQQSIATIRIRRIRVRATKMTNFGYKLVPNDLGSNNLKNLNINLLSYTWKPRSLTFLLLSRHLSRAHTTSGRRAVVSACDSLHHINQLLSSSHSSIHRFVFSLPLSVCFRLSFSLSLLNSNICIRTAHGFEYSCYNPSHRTGGIWVKPFNSLELRAVAGEELMVYLAQT